MTDFSAPLPQITSAGKPLTNRWMVLALLFGIAVFNQADRYLLSGLVESIKADFGISDGFMGLLMGPAFAILYSSLAIPIAIYADRGSRIAIITVGCIIWSIFTILSGFAPNEWYLAAARVGVGVGEAAFQAPAYSLIAAYFPTTQRGRAFAVLALAVYFGQALGLGGGPSIAAFSDWRTAFMIMGGGGLVVILIAWLVIREPARSDDGPARVPILPLIAKLLPRRSYVLMTLGLAIGVFSGISFAYWGVALFQRSYDLTPEVAGSSFALTFALPGMFGALLFGFVADRIAQNGQAKMLLMSAVALAIATIAVLGATWADTFGMALVWALPAGLFGGGWAVGIYVALQYILPDRLRATGTAISMLALNLLGYVIAPFLAGILSDALAGQEESLRLAISIVVPTGLIGSVLLWLAARHLENDKAKLEEPA